MVNGYIKAEILSGQPSSICFIPQMWLKLHLGIVFQIRVCVIKEKVIFPSRYLKKWGVAFHLNHHVGVYCINVVRSPYFISLCHPIL